MTANPVRFSFDGTPLEAPRGMTVGGALLANGIVSWRRTRTDDRPRGIFCGIGVCFDCLVDVNDQHAVRACLIQVRDGDKVGTSNSRGAVRRGAEQPEAAQPGTAQPGTAR